MLEANSTLVGIASYQIFINNFLMFTKKTIGRTFKKIKLAAKVNKETKLMSIEMLRVLPQTALRFPFLNVLHNYRGIEVNLKTALV